MDKWNEIWHTITQNRMRSILTAFGIFWGIFMLIIMVGLGNAMERGIYSKIGGFATNSSFFSDGTTTQPYKGFQKGRTWNIRTADLAVIKSRVPQCDIITPIIFGGQSTNNVLLNDRYGTYSIKGCLPNYTQMQAVNLKFGRYINDIDIQEKRKVCFIGETIYDELFPQRNNPIGTYIRVNSIYYKIVGVEKKGSGGINLGGRPETTVVLPLTTMQQAYNMGDKIHLLGITTQPNIPVSQIQEKVTEVLRQQHQIAPTDKAAVFSMNLEEQFNMLKYLSIGISALIWLVGIGTLIAGAVGVSNIMLVTIKERTKEIGIRRAIGAHPRHIATQIMSESLVLTVMAGVVGVMVGIGVLQLLELGMSAPDSSFKNPQISFQIAILSLSVLGIIGLLAGLMPTIRALRVKPIEALGEE